MNHYTPPLTCRECHRPAWCRGLCGSHYQKYRREGTLEKHALPLGAIRVGRPRGTPKTGGARRKT